MRERAGLGGLCRELGSNELAFTPTEELEEREGAHFHSEQPWSAHLQLEHWARTAASAFGPTPLGSAAAAAHILEERVAINPNYLLFPQILHHVNRLWKATVALWSLPADSEDSTPSENCNSVALIQEELWQPHRDIGPSLFLPCKEKAASSTAVSKGHSNLWYKDECSVGKNAVVWVLLLSTRYSTH